MPGPRLVIAEQGKERLLQDLVDALSDHAIYMLDADGRIAIWNAGAHRLMGYTAPEVQGQSYGRFFTPSERRAGLPQSILARAATEGQVAVQGWRVRKDGSRFWATGAVHAVRDQEGRLTGFGKITRDMTAEREAQEALQESERQFRLLVSGVVDYALYMLDPNGVVANWNAGAQHIKGYAAEEIVGQHFSRFYTEADRAGGLPARALETARDEGRYEADGWSVRKDGSLFWATVVIDAIHDEAGHLIGYAKITRDITERRDAQLELQRAHEQLSQAQKLEALGKLTGGVAHDFNNLLMVVSGQAQLLRSRLAHDPRALRALDAIEASARRGEDLTRHLLTFARRQRLQPIAISLTDRIEAFRELLSTSLPESVRLVFDLDEGLWPAHADLNELELALLNLSVNARDAMPGGGVLTLRAENAVLDGLEAESGLHGEFVAVSMSDTGVGIAPDILPRIFDPFFTTKSVDKGTGLGLSQVFGFAQQSGGRLAVDSELGRGTAFTLYLPRALAPSEAGVDEAPVADRPDARILLVEDNPEVAEVAAGMLEQLGYETRVVGAAAAALAAFEEGEAPDLVFSDIVMAGDLNGVELARRIREKSDVPILLATGYSQAAERLGGEFAILRKPYRISELGHAIGALLARGPTRIQG